MERIKRLKSSTSQVVKDENTWPQTNRETASSIRVLTSFFSLGLFVHFDAFFNAHTSVKIIPNIEW